MNTFCFKDVKPTVIKHKMIETTMASSFRFISILYNKGAEGLKWGLNNNK